MKASLQVKLGDKVLEIGGEGADTQIIKSLAFWSALPSKCGKCKSEEIGLEHKAPKGNDYYGLKCLSCGAVLNFHQRKPDKGGGFYLTKDDKWEIWEGKKEDNQSETYEAPKDDTIPF